MQLYSVLINCSSNLFIDLRLCAARLLNEIRALVTAADTFFCPDAAQQSHAWPTSAPPPTARPWWTSPPT